LLAGIAVDADRPISQLPLLTEAERQQVLIDWNVTLADYPQQACIHQLFEAQVERTPETAAVVFGDQHLSYAELNQRANQLAHHLRELGVGPQALVGLCLERSLEMVVGMLGVLKAGGAYVPLDPTYPSERLAFILQDARAPLLLTQVRLLTGLPKPWASRAIVLDSAATIWKSEKTDNQGCDVSPTNLAYVIYTSGSTGTPKGVAMPHGPLVNLITWQVAHSSMGNEDRTLQFTTMSFDVSFQEIFATWCSGGTLVVVSEEVRRDLARLTGELEKQGIARLFLPFVALQQLAETCCSNGVFPRGLREVITAGERLQVTPALRHFFAQLRVCSLHNHYGPTESHVVTAFALEKMPASWPEFPPIGRPIANTRVYVLDTRLQLVPPGIPGELYIGGGCLARGYLNRPELTTEKFIADPFGSQPGTRLYRTGDRVRWRADGTLEFLGRLDDQVKLRGFRIELGEIETLLNAHPSVAHGVVVLREDRPGDKRLVAYCVSASDAAWNVTDLARYLRSHLPDYMVPSAFVQLEALPLTSSGKVNRRVLPAPDVSRLELETSYVAPRNPLEHQLVSIWCEVLGMERAGIHDHFFELGGHSLLALQLIHKINAAFGLELPVRLLFEQPTAAGQAREIERALASRNQEAHVIYAPLVPLRVGGNKPPFFLVAGGFGGEAELLVYAKLARYFDSQQPVYGLRARGVDELVEPHQTVELMAAEYVREIRTIQPHGPYFIGGSCIGGVVALEIAQQLRAQGEPIGLLVLVDSQFPTRQGMWMLRYRLRTLWCDQVLPFLRRCRASRREFWAAVRESILLRFAPSREQKIGRLKVRIGQKYLLHILRYKPRPYPGPVTLILSREHNRREPDRVWRDLAGGGLEVLYVPGDHFTHLREHVQITAARIGACLEAAQAHKTAA
jgi:amino acid adenylation domain-containing protein